jgi:hypothetical protein
MTSALLGVGLMAALFAAFGLLRRDGRGANVCAAAPRCRRLASGPGFSGCCTYPRRQLGLESRAQRPAPSAQRPAPRAQSPEPRAQ